MRTTQALNAGAFALSGSFMVVFPLLPALQERAGISTAQLGWIATAGFVAALVAQLLVVPHADRGRERLVITAAVIVMALSTLTYTLGDSIAWFVAGRVGAGLAYGAFIPTAVGMIVRHCPDRHGERIGRLHSLDLAGMAVGPLVAVVGKMTIGLDATLVVASIATVVVATPALLAHWPSASGPADTGAEAMASTVSPRAALALLRHRSVVAAALLVTAFFLPIGAYDALFPRFLTDLGARDWVLGLALLAFAVPSMLLAGWAGRLIDRIGPFTAAARGGLANIVVVLAYAVVRIPMVVVAIGLFESGGQAVVGAAGAAAMGWAVPGRRAATAQGLGEAVGTVAGALMAAMSAPLYAVGGPAALFGVTALVTAVAVVSGVRLGLAAAPVEPRLAPAPAPATASAV